MCAAARDHASARQENLTRVVNALGAGDNEGAHEFGIELVNMLGENKHKDDEWSCFNVLFKSEAARDALVKGNGYDQDTKSKITMVTCDQDKSDGEKMVTVHGHEIELCIFNEGDIEQTKMFVDKGLRMGKADGLDWLLLYIPIISKLDRNNAAYQALVKQIARLHVERTNHGKTVKLLDLDVVGNNFVTRIGCKDFGDLPGVGQFPYAKDKLHTVCLSYSMTGNRHRCYRSGKDKCILTSKHEACDECRKPRRIGKKRGGQYSHDERQERKENARMPPPPPTRATTSRPTPPTTSSPSPPTRR